MNKKHSFSKTQFSEGIRCERLLWLRMNKPELAEKFDDTTLHLFEVGRKVELLARVPFPGILIEREGVAFNDLTKKTDSMMLNHSMVLYEGTFHAKNCICRADILEPISEDKASPWNLHEIKMSSEVKVEHITDCGFQQYCIEQAGYAIHQINLIHIDSEYIRLGEINPLQLFKIEDITDIAREASNKIGEKIRELIIMCSMSKPPKLILGSRCKNPGKCQFYNFCHKDVCAGSVYELPFGTSIIPKLLESGIEKITDIPEELPLTKRHQLVRRSAKSRKAVIDYTAVSEFIKTMKYPLYFFDFETISPSIPPFDYSSPYEKVPFQYSLHLIEEPGSKPQHFEYLHDSRTDPRIPITEQLIKHLGGAGSIVAWNKSFEESVLRTLSLRFPNYAKSITNLLNRFVDLIVPFRSAMYVDYRFKGSSSIKNVLPVLVPKVSYDGMSIKRGDEASLMFEKYIDKSLSEDEWQTCKKELLQYCELDTWAMVEIYRRLIKITKGRV